MERMVRLSFTLDPGLHRRLEALRRQHGYRNRSEFLRDILRDRLVAEAWRASAEPVVGTVTLVYDHHTPGVTERLTRIQHDHHTEVLAATHVHLSHHTCVEVILVRGRAREVAALADALGRERGVLHASLATTAPADAMR